MRYLQLLGGAIDFAISPLEVDHGLREERYGRYSVAISGKPMRLSIKRSQRRADWSWPALVEAARRRFPNLEIGELHANSALAREPFEASLRDRSLELMKVLNDYVVGRDETAVDGPVARELVENYFTGERALFTGEFRQTRNSLPEK